MRLARLALRQQRHLQLRAIEIRVIGNERVGSSFRRQIAKSLSGLDVGLEALGRPREVESGTAPFGHEVRLTSIFDWNQRAHRPKGAARRGEGGEGSVA